jgi:lysophospholipase L1-like esterase
MNMTRRAVLPLVVLLALVASCSTFTPTAPTLLIGDSIVGWFPVSEYLPGRDLATWGIYAAYIETLTARAADLMPLRPQRLIVCVGCNNLQRGDPVEEVAAKYDALLAALIRQFPLMKITVHAVLPMNDSRVPWSYFMAANAAIRDVATRHRFVFIDATAAFLEEEGKVRPEMFEGTVHLTPAGYQAWADFLGGVL